MQRVLIALAATAALAGSAFAQAPAPAAPNFVTVPQDAITSDRLDDVDLRNAANEKVGEIEDAVISQGRLVGYVISVGGFLGVGERNVVVDPSAVMLTYNEADKAWRGTINATKEQLQAAPEFKYEGRWKD
ncbi:PRC-barrel domain-containing protein [Microvirga pudoricolor]|uniref:PRC-barrel domain-containing protein n=1 Tax=Microvirga pudoricolor TaxID=2778729 RepID=UPI001952054F|nr:PRC-barrel domain-containing protein [Microvirga pudoricolor]MBM6595192.1 PRC-barrel domain-containing protein [Microvirga pudoricolor]